NFYNDKFLNRVIDDKATVEGNINAYINGKDLFEIINSEETPIYLNEHSYTLYSNSFESEGITNYILFYVDNTALREIEKKYNSSKPCVIYIEADNVGDSILDLRDSERAEIRSLVVGEIEKWTGHYSCIMKRLSENRYIVIAEKTDVDKMIESKFSVLDSVRQIKYKDMPVRASLSIGVANGKTFSECEKLARKALDMAVGRGGDQAAVANNESYDYYGGISKTVEKQGRVETRIIGSAFSELIEGSDDVIVMGHRNPDLDAIGAALGVCAVCESLGVPAFIATDKDNTLCSALINRILSDENQSVSIIDEQTAINLLDKKTLLVIVDTHIKSFVEFPEVYNKASSVFVIDHHRKSVGFIDNALVFYHNPGASSACEMVTELLQYTGSDVVISGLTADALLAGIMLDTKNFVLGTGVRTFQAAAYLRKYGADTVNVHKMFANSFDNYVLRNRIVSKSKQYKNCAISYADFESPDLRVICSQAADEMMNIQNVKASFVLYGINDVTCISARSYGERNVQIIMEEFGGGGHQSMAAAQIPDDSLESSLNKLLKTIDEKYN
ncbi:MAG: DHH family phosphoesterase, partial [Clostridia bacterium]|nr:DHH family phosphoesterase [Clostridia bacterium]